MTGLGKWSENAQAEKKPRLKARRIKSRRKSLLPSKERTSGPRESAAVHFVQTDLLGFGDDSKMSDNSPAVVKTVEKLSAARSDGLVLVQEKEARSLGGNQPR
jgi:hypothetical protein